MLLDWLRPNGVLHIKKIEIKAAHDLILLSHPRNDPLHPDQGKSSLRYPAQKMKASSSIPYSEEYLVSLLKEEVIWPRFRTWALPLTSSISRRNWFSRM